MENLMKGNKDLYDHIAKSAANVILYFQDDERENMITRLRTEVEKLCSIEERFKLAEEISERIASSYDPEAASEDAKNNLVEKYTEEISKITTDPSKDKNLKEFDRRVHALKKDADGKARNASADDIELTQDTVNVIDPVTKRRMTDPVRNVMCSHIYDRESIAALLKVNPNTCCPVPGCRFKDPLLMSNMESDIVTKTYLERNPA